MTTIEEVRKAMQVLEVAEDEGLVLGMAVLTVEDLDSRQTRDEFDSSAIGDRMLDTGLRMLWEESRPGCSCDYSCTDDDCKEANPNA